MRPLLIVLLLCLSLPVMASELRTFDLRHRSADELIPIIQPVLDADAAISGTGYTLIVRSSKENLRQIASLVEQLDQAPQQLLITVEQGGEQQGSRIGAEVPGSRSEQRIGARVYSSEREKLDSIGQQLRVMEGQWATIRAGQSIPQVVQQYRHSASGSEIEHRIEYKDVESGFEVRPLISGDEVTLEIRPFRATPSQSGGGVIEQQSLFTTVRGKLGQWMDIGGHTEQQKQHEYGTIYTTKERDQLLRNIRLKVERINH